MSLSIFIPSSSHVFDSIELMCELSLLVYNKSCRYHQVVRYCWTTQNAMDYTSLGHWMILTLLKFCQEKTLVRGESIQCMIKYLKTVNIDAQETFISCIFTLLYSDQCKTFWYYHHECLIIEQWNVPNGGRFSKLHSASHPCTNQHSSRGASRKKLLKWWAVRTTVYSTDMKICTFKLHTNPSFTCRNCTNCTCSFSKLGWSSTYRCGWPKASAKWSLNN